MTDEEHKLYFQALEELDALVEKDPGNKKSISAKFLDAILPCPKKQEKD